VSIKKASRAKKRPTGYKSIDMTFLGVSRQGEKKKQRKSISQKKHVKHFLQKIKKHVFV
jgi:hypothetical protein